MTVEELKGTRETLWNAAKKFLDDHTGKDGKISAEDAAFYEKMESEIVGLGKQIDRFKEEEKYNMEKLSGVPMLLYPANDYTSYDQRGIGGDEYKKNFMNAIKTNFKNNYLREGSLPDGGYLLPVEWHDEIISALSQANILREIGRVIQTASEHKINIVATKPHGLLKGRKFLSLRRPSIKYR